MCGPALAEIVAAEIDASPEQVGQLKVRPPLKPVPLGEIAAMELDNAAQVQADIFKNMKK